MSTPKEVIQGKARWSVVRADMREVLSLLPDRSVDHCITDAPYSPHTHESVRRGGSIHKPDDTTPGRPKRAVISSSTVLGFDALDPEVQQTTAFECARLVRRWSLMFSDQEGVAGWMAAMARAELEHVRVGQWVKLGATPQFTGDRPGNGCEAVVISHPRGRKRWNGGGSLAVWTHPIVRGGTAERWHTTQKPLSLMLQLIEQFTEPGELVVDPFCGSGITGLACIMRGRRFIGVDVDAKSAKTAERVIRAEERSGTLRRAS